MAESYRLPLGHNPAVTAVSVLSVLSECSFPKKHVPPENWKLLQVSFSLHIFAQSYAFSPYLPWPLALMQEPSLIQR